MSKFVPRQDVLTELGSLVCRAKAELLSCPMDIIVYPQGNAPGKWNSDEISEMNREVLDRLANKGNVYAIFLSSDEEWVAVYVGQRKSEKLRERMMQHLVKKHKKTGGQLANVQCAVAEGKRIGISYVLIEPSSLRHYVEESIIVARGDGELPWNKHG